MQLKKLEMVGFKSFADKTEVVFEPGVTCIVGPNGCGKSNVVDAVKWVLGTLSHKSVRGEEMIDVIFKGAEGVGPAGMAEVSLTLDNSDRTFSIDFEEVTITRRLHASGEGEYLINKTPCRLRDIRDLLYGTGIGTDNYSIIEQGKIDRLITSDPRQRRLIFDEAAGLSRYRARKKEAEHRLEKVTQDLLRMSDIVREVQRELRSVRSQAGRAARYKELQADHREKRLCLLGHEVRNLQAQIRRIQERGAALESDKSARERAWAERGAELERIEEALAAATARCSERSQELSAAVSRSEYVEKSIAAARQRLDELGESRARARQERDAAAALLEGKQTLLEQALRDREAWEAERRSFEDRIRQASDAVQDASNECRRVAEELKLKKDEAVERAQREAGYRNDLAQVRSETEALAQRQGRAQDQERRAVAELEELRAKNQESASRRAELEAVIADLKRSILVSEVEQARLKEESATLDGELTQLRAAKERGESRRETLRELEVGMEGLSAGARQLLRLRPAGLRGTVADLLETAPADVPVVEAALGETAGALLFESREQVWRAIDYLRQNNLPRTTLLSLDQCQDAAWNDVPGIRVSTLVRVEDRYRILADALLGDARVVETDAEAEALRPALAPGRMMVTRAGDVFDGRGLTSVGRRPGGLLSRKAELKALEQEIEQYLGLIAQKEERKRALTERLGALDRALSELRHAVYDQGIALGEVAALWEQNEKRLRLVEEERDHLAAEQRQIESHRAALAEQAGRLELLLSEMAELRQQIEREIRDLADTSSRYEEGREQLRQDLTRLRVECATVEEKLQSAEARVSMLRAEMEQYRGTVQRQEEHLKQIEAREAAAAEDVSAREREREESHRDIAQKRAAVDEASSARAARQAEEDAIRDAMSELEQALGAVTAETQNLRVQEAQQQAILEQRLERARDEYQMEPSQVEHLPEPADPVDWEALSREADELRAKIASFGAVNVVALEQLRELEERERTLLAQQEDIESAKRQLETLIGKINRESKELFERTLDFVREQFSQIFRKVFGGGKADIVLQQEEGVDAFDQGLEVMVRIPQREMLPISALSGGQKSLTAFSLVMALFKANPSPFCVLDEADAALDEANVDKYAALVNEFVHETQFIVITHNKRTMVAADVLYGVTMERPGISKKVSVDLHGELGLETLRQRRDELRRSRAESASRKAARMAEVRAAAEAAASVDAPEAEGGAAATAVLDEEAAENSDEA
ncbi:MAG: chromosome segregation protein SMC [Planctomycetes bacterium]|nr:chromosome segregation protein SMC [Planctomycetota bacterium]